MKWLTIIIFIMCINWLLITVYCRIERIIDKKKFQREAKLGNISTNLNSNSSLIKVIYQWINSYVYGWVRYNIILIGHLPSYRIRKLFYRYIFAMRITRKTVIFGGCEFRSPWNISIGKSTIGSNCILDGRGGINIEDNVVLGSGVHIWTEEHSPNDPYFRVLKENLQPVYINNRAWVCSDTTILPGICIGEGAVLASRACATCDCEPFGVYGGIPARKIAERNKELKYELNGNVSWHFM